MNSLEDVLQLKHRFRDPIYGFIQLNDSELKIIDTPVFQRLRRIHQLSLSKYVYPTAEHTRFTHSLGVLQMATNIFKNLYKDKDKDEEYVKQLKIVRFAALLHDIGHTPFSHSSEKIILGEKVKHENLGQYIIENYEPVKQIIINEDINPKIAGSLLAGVPIADYIILKNIISGHLDADRADYLLRDSYFCGVKYGEYDFNRFCTAFDLRNLTNGGFKLCIKERDIYLIEAFLLARYHYNLQVPFHRTRAGYDIVIEKYMEYLKKNNKIPDFIKIEDNQITSMDFEMFEQFDDYSIFENIKKDRKTNKWANMLLRGDHLIPVVDRIIIEGTEFIDIQEVISHLNNNFVENEDFFIYNKTIEVSKLIEDTGKTGILGVLPNNNSEPQNILNYSNILQQLVKPIKIIRIYVTKEHKEEINDIISETRKRYKKFKKVEI